MYCKHCGEKIIRSSKFCKQCGEIVPKTNWFARNKSKSIVLVSAVIIVALYSFNAGYLSAYVGIIPPIKTGEKTIILQCKYAGKNLSVSTKLYENINEYYRNYDYYNKDQYLENGQFDKFVYVSEKDSSISILVTEIRKVAESNGLYGDQILEFASCLVQNIPYDDQKSKTVLDGSIGGNTAGTEQYPYQTLFLNKGICTDKAYLGSAILGELGYSTALMDFASDQHLTLGVKVPKEYASFNTDYAILDVTNTGFSPGAIPAKINDNGTPYNSFNNINSISKNDNPSNISLYSNQAIGPLTGIVTVNKGKMYTRITAVKNLENQINEMYNSLNGKKADLEKAYGNIGYWNNRQAQAYADYVAEPSTKQTCYPRCSYYPYYSCYDYCYSTTNFTKSLKRSTYNNYYNNYTNAVSNYNNLVNDYNATLEKIRLKTNLYNSYQYN